MWPDKAICYKPGIVEVVEHAGVALRKAGRELVGLCPFHAEKTPSFAVNPDKGLFYCHGCHEGGDVITLIMKLRGLSYREALAELGMDTTRPKRPREPDALLIEARKLAAWENEMTARAESLLREIGQKARLAAQVHDEAFLRSLKRQWAILSDLADDLQDEKVILGLYRQREGVEAVLADAIIEADSIEWPPLTADYLNFLRDHLPSEGISESRCVANG